MLGYSTITEQKQIVVQQTPVQNLIQNLDEKTDLLHREMKEIMYNTLAGIDIYNTTKARILDKYASIASVPELFNYIDDGHLMRYLNPLNELHDNICNSFSSTNDATCEREYMIAVTTVNRDMVVYNRWAPQVGERIDAIATILQPLLVIMVDSKSPDDDRDTAASAALESVCAL